MNTLRYKDKNTSMTRIAFTLALITGSTLLFASCGGKKSAPPPPPPAVVGVEQVAYGDVSYHESYPATITAAEEVELRPQVSGYITGIHFRDGQRVQKGQLLYSIDQQAYQAGVSEAQARLAVAKANLNRAQKDADRYIELDKKNAIAKQMLDHAMADLESARMQVKAAEAGVQSVQTNLKYANIYAPFSGTIGISLVKLGASVSPGATLLNTISTDDPINVDFFLDQKDLGRFMALQQSGNIVKDSTFTIVLPDNSKYQFAGRVASIDRAVDARTGTIRVRLAFDNRENQLRPGMSATVKVYHKSTDQSIVIPHKAVTEQMGEYFVYKATDSSTVTQTKVKLGMQLKDKVAVLEGLEQGQKIVVDGLQRVREGAKIQEAPAETGNNSTTQATPVTK